MKWRTLTEPHSGIIRCIDTKRVLSEEEIAVVLEGRFHKRNDELEWLDESPIDGDAVMSILRGGFAFSDACDAYDEIIKIIEL